MSADDCRPRAISSHQIITTRASKLRLNAGFASKIPNFQRAIMTTGDNLLRFADKLRCHHFATVTRERMLERKGKNEQIKVMDLILMKKNKFNNFHNK